MIFSVTINMVDFQYASPVSWVGWDLLPVHWTCWTLAVVIGFSDEIVSDGFRKFAWILSLCSIPTSRQPIVDSFHLHHILPSPCTAMVRTVLVSTFVIAIRPVVVEGLVTDGAL